MQCRRGGRGRAGRRRASPSTRPRDALSNETRGKTYDAGAAVAEGRGDPRRAAASSPSAAASSATSVRARPEVRVSRTPSSRGRMTTTEQIVWAHRVDKDAEVRAGRDAARLRGPAAGLGRHGALRDPHVQPDHRRTHDLAAPGRDRERPLRLHRPARTTRGRRRSARRSRGSHGLEKPVLRDAGRRHLPLLLPRAGPRDAGAVHPGRRLAQPRVRRVRRRRHRRRLDDARLRLVDRLHLLHARPAAPRRLPRHAPALGERARTSCSSCCGAGARSSRRACRSSSWTPTGSSRSPYRNTIANMMAEAEAQNGIFAPGRDHRRVVSREGDRRAPLPARRARRGRALRDRRDPRLSATSSR